MSFKNIAQYDPLYRIQDDSDLIDYKDRHVEQVGPDAGLLYLTAESVFF